MILKKGFKTLQVVQKVSGKKISHTNYSSVDPIAKVKIINPIMSKSSLFKISCVCKRKTNHFTNTLTAKKIES